MIEGLFIIGTLIFLFLFRKFIKLVRKCEVTKKHVWIPMQDLLLEVYKCEYCDKIKARFVD